METNQNENNRAPLDEAVQPEEAVENTQPAAEEAAEAAPEQGPAEEQETVREQEAPEKQPEPKQEPSGKNGRSGKISRKDKWKRGGMATLMSVIFIAIVVVINILVSVLTDRFPSLNVDLTAQKLNSLSDQALEIARGVEQDTAIYLIGAEEKYRKDRIYASYSLEYSQVANLAEKLQEANPKISVKFIDPDTNPGFISNYPSENLGTGMVLVETEKRHKALDINDLFGTRTNQTTGQSEMFSKVDSALAAALEVVNMDKVPVLTLATGHNEKLDSQSLSGFQAMIEEENFQVKEINFLTDEIPEDTQILMLPTPSTDYTEEEIDKLRAFLDDETRADSLTLLVTCHSTQGELPRFSSFLEEWGIRVEQGMLAETDSSRMAAANPSFMLVNADQEQILSDGEYRNLVAAASCPLTVLFEGNGDVGVDPLWVTADSAYVITEDMEALPENPDTAQYTVAALADKYIQVDGKNAARNVVVFGSSYVFTDSFITAPAYGDGSYIMDLLQFCTGTDSSRVSVMTQQVTTLTRDVTMTQSAVTVLGLGVFTIGLPLIILMAGLAIFLKRRHL